ncbi:hypothetical protein JCM3766R1_006013 [Sporobolomyces carnicolor]
MPPPRAFQPVRRPKGGPPSTVMTLAPLSEEAESTDFTLPITPKALSAAGRQAKEEVDEEWHAASSGIQQVSDKLTAIVELASKQGDSPSALAAWQVAFVADYRAAGGTNWVLRNALDKLDKALQVITEKVGKRGLKRREWSVKAEWHFPHLAGPGNQEMCWKVHELEKLLTLLKKINQQEKLNVDTKVFDAWRMDLGGKLWAYFLGSHDPGTAWLHVNYEIFRLKYLLLSHCPVTRGRDVIPPYTIDEILARVKAWST